MTSCAGVDLQGLFVSYCFDLGLDMKSAASEQIGAKSVSKWKGLTNSTNFLILIFHALKSQIEAAAIMPTSSYLLMSNWVNYSADNWAAPGIWRKVRSRSPPCRNLSRLAFMKKATFYSKEHQIKEHTQRHVHLAVPFIQPFWRWTQVFNIH